MPTPTPQPASPAFSSAISSDRSKGHTRHPLEFPVHSSQPHKISSSQSTSLGSATSASSLPISFGPGGHRSLSGISLRSFLLGFTLGVCINLTAILLYCGVEVWRIPCFIAVLCVFHYLEFDMTARYNTVDAKVTSFLLFNNGAAYDVANGMAVVECLGAWVLRWVGWRAPGYEVVAGWVPTVPGWVAVCLGGGMVVFGQGVRSLAMRTAGRSFNHMVQMVKRRDHVLVTDGVYAWCRHPSYLGFFWWGLGMQILLGNRFCLVVYAVVLWNFFASRIENEEKHLINFFGQEYLEYRSRVPVLIPFIR